MGKNAMLLVEKRSGEVVGEINGGDRIVRSGSIRSYVTLKRADTDEGNDTIRMSYKQFTFINVEELNALTRKGMLKSDELAVLMAIQSFVDFKSCAVVREDGEIATLKDISEVCGYSVNKTHSVLNRLVDKMLLAKTVTGKYILYFVNPWICRKGTSVNATLLDMFGKYRVMSKGGIEWKQLVKGNRR